MALFLAFLVLGTPSACAYDAPRFQGDVLDETGQLSGSEREALQARIQRLRDESGIWAAVYLANSLQGGAIEEAANITFRRWTLGQEGVNNGLLVLVVPSERKMRIEVGYGLEGEITDAVSKGIIEAIYKPAFREGRFAEGLLAGFDAMAEIKGGGSAGAWGELTDSLPLQEEAPFDWDVAGERFLWTAGLNLTPAALFALAIAWGRRAKRGAEWKELKVPLIIGLFLGGFFGIFVGVFTAAMPEEPGVALGIGLFNLLFVLSFAIPFLLSARRYFSAAGYRRALARDRLIRIRKRTSVGRNILGKWFDPEQVSVSQGGTMIASSNSGSDFGSGSSSSSSSSGGGSSGGGGASGSW